MSPAQAALIDGYDTALFDLDGVIYLGPQPVPGAAEAVKALRERQVRVGFVTNNAARPPEAVAAHLVELGVQADRADVVTSAQAGARLLRDRFGPGAAVLAVGGPGVYAALEEAGLRPVEVAEDDPVAVMQGYGPDLSWNRLIEAAVAIHRGAHWLATNTDSTRPTERGIVPGNGAAVDAVRTAVEVDPEVAGKPYPPLITETLRRLGGGKAIFVGDRIDTDIEGAAALDLDSLLVFTGAHGAAELIAAGPGERPTAIGWNVGALLQPTRTVHVADQDGSVTVGTQVVRYQDGTLTLDTEPVDRETALDAVWAGARLCWRLADDHHLDPDRSRLLEAVNRLLR